jgi:hypothetical protein
MPRINSLLSQVENVVRISTVDNYPDFWEENHITFDLLKGIRRALNYSVIENASNNVTINWRIYKQRKRENERDYGDIALIVKLLYQDKDELEGVAFLEAKRKFENTLAFDSAKTDQLKRIDNHSTTAMMLLYDFNDITKFASIEALSNYRQEWFELRPCTHAVVVLLEQLYC